MAVELFRTAPNGMKTDIVYLLEVPNADFSGTEYRISYRWYTNQEPEEVGQVSLIDGIIRFTGGQLSLPALKLLHDWLCENVEGYEAL